MKKNYSFDLHYNLLEKEEDNSGNIYYSLAERKKIEQKECKNETENKKILGEKGEQRAH